MLMANAVSQLAAKTPGKEAAAMEAFAAALRQVQVKFANGFSGSPNTAREPPLSHPNRLALQILQFHTRLLAPLANFFTSLG